MSEPSIHDLPKVYDAALVEEALYASWESRGFFQPERLPERTLAGEPYSIMMPPPNRTGTLHMGHAAMLAIEDVLIRYARMCGKKALWLPGTDHAAIATQVKVEQMLIKEGMKDPRRELGREAFLERVRAFADESGKTINRQVRKMGSSCDWSREKYTFDEDRNRAVNELFKRMLEDGIIERGYRVVNWDPQFQTTLSDDEVQTKDVTAKLYTFTYDKDFPITISTTRPETKFGDVAVAVHPDDKRYQAFIGKTFTPNFCGVKLSICVIADTAVDPAFGTGALGVTPAHSMIDAEMAERHGLTMIQVIGPDGKMLTNTGEASGKTIEETRTWIEAFLQQAGLLQKVEDVAQALPIAERGGAVVEQLPMKQWFVRVNKPFALRQNTLGKWKKGDTVTLKELMLHAVTSGQTRIVPDRFEKIYFHWIENLRDWCISRQIWFGHQIPVWYKDGEQEIVSDTAPGKDWTRDPDTLDTWFSSGAWTFSTLGWPDTASVDVNGNLVKTGDLAAFHPTAVLETGYDIIFFWVARMILMSVYALGEVPFKDVYLHGLVRDEQGRKMSKSLGNILDPLDLIPKYGTDAVRLSLLIGSTPGQDVKLSEAKIEGFRNFTNKLWNISRFVLTHVDASKLDTDWRTQEWPDSGSCTLAEHFFLSQLADIIVIVHAQLNAYFLSSAGETLRDFTWTEFADWCLEIAKTGKIRDEVLICILRNLLRLWHPFMPFVTEEIWQKAGFGGQDGWLIVETYPERPTDRTDSKPWRDAFNVYREAVVAMRRLRLEQGVEAAKKVSFAFVTSNTKEAKEQIVWMKRLTNAEEITLQDVLPEQWPSVVFTGGAVALNPVGAVDLTKEREKMSKEIASLEAYVQTTQKKLADQDFIQKAPAHVVDAMKQKLQEAQEKIETLASRLRQYTL